jgi:hypothetical protein
MNFDDVIKISPNDPAYKDAVRQYLEGQYDSNWYFLIHAIRSNLLHAGKVTNKLINIYERVKTNDQRRAETLLVINMNYSLFLSGPLLGTILMACAALEVFLRMCMRAFWEQESPSKKRGRGVQDDLLKKIDEFDKLAANQKLKRAYKSLLEREVPTEINEGFKSLMAFRNNCYHSDPVLIKSTGTHEETRGRHKREVTYRSDYPFLWSGNRPLSFSHALQAIRLHDAIAKDLLIKRHPPLHLHSDLHDEDPEGNFIENGLPKAISPDDLNQLADDWDSVDKQLEAVSVEEQRVFLRDIQRKTTLRPVE